MKTLDICKITLPGLTRRYRFLHISDAHAAFAYPDEGEEAAAFAEQQSKRWQGDELPPIGCLERALAFAAEEKLDGILAAGDMVDYYSPGCVRCIHEAAAASPVEWIYAYGNHESGSYHRAVEAPRAFHGEYADLMGGDPAFHVRDFGEFLVAVLDDSDKVITPAQMDSLKALAGRGLPILLLLHIPLATPSGSEKIMKVWGPSFMIGAPGDSAALQEFCAWVKSPESRIAAIFAGHLHFAQEGEFAPGRMQFVSAPCCDGFARLVEIS